MSDALARPPKPARPGPLLPPGQASDAGLVFVVAVLCFFACLTALAVMASDRAARGWRMELQGSATVIVRPKGDQTPDGAAAIAAEALAAVKGVDEAAALGRDKAEALVRPWMGGGDLPEDLPIPRLVAVELSKTSPADAAALKRALSTAGVDATVDDHHLWIEEIVRAGRWARIAASGVFVLMAGAAAAVIAFATRAGLEARRGSIEVLHLAGAEDRFVAGLFQARFARMAAVAGLFAAASAAMIGAAVRALGGGQGLTPVLPVAWADLVWLAVCPFIAALVAAVAARVSALKLLKDMA
jgi:cell division transport system permease protein